MKRNETKRTSSREPIPICSDDGRQPSVPRVGGGERGAVPRGGVGVAARGGGRGAAARRRVRRLRAAGRRAARPRRAPGPGTYARCTLRAACCILHTARSRPLTDTCVCVCAAHAGGDAQRARARGGGAVRAARRRVPGGAARGARPRRRPLPAAPLHRHARRRLVSVHCPLCTVYISPRALTPPAPPQGGERGQHRAAHRRRRVPRPPRLSSIRTYATRFDIILLSFSS